VGVGLAPHLTALCGHEDPISKLVREAQDKRPLRLSESFGVDVSPAPLVQLKSDFGLHLLAMHIPHDGVQFWILSPVYFVHMAAIEYACVTQYNRTKKELLVEFSETTTQQAYFRLLYFVATYFGKSKQRMGLLNIETAAI
jgi:hypothetical protein